LRDGREFGFKLKLTEYHPKTRIAIVEVLFIKQNLRYGILNLNFLLVQPFVSNFIMSMASVKLNM
jgi:hypothetical protein